MKTLIALLVLMTSSALFSQWDKIPVIGAPFKQTITATGTQRQLQARGAPLISLQVTSNGGDTSKYVVEGTLDNEHWYPLSLGNKGTGLVDDTISVEDTTDIGYELMTSDEEYVRVRCVSWTAGSADFLWRGRASSK